MSVSSSTAPVSVLKTDGRPWGCSRLFSLEDWTGGRRARDRQAGHLGTCRGIAGSNHDRPPLPLRLPFPVAGLFPATHFVALPSSAALASSSLGCPRPPYPPFRRCADSAAADLPDPLASARLHRCPSFSSTTLMALWKAGCFFWPCGVTGFENRC